MSSVSQQCLDSSRYYRYLWKKRTNKRMSGSRFLLPFSILLVIPSLGNPSHQHPLCSRFLCLRLRAGCGSLSVMGAVSSGSSVTIFPELQEGRGHALVQAQAESTRGTRCPRCPCLARPLGVRLTQSCGHCSPPGMGSCPEGSPCFQTEDASTAGQEKHRNCACFFLIWKQREEEEGGGINRRSQKHGPPLPPYLWYLVFGLLQNRVFDDPVPAEPNSNH